MGLVGNAGSSRSSPHNRPKSNFNNNRSAFRRIEKDTPATISPQQKSKCSDVVEQIDFIDRFSDEGDCTWLSSESATPSLHSSDDSQDIWELDNSEHTLHDRLSSVLSLSSSSTSPLGEDVGNSLSHSATTILPNQASLLLDTLCEDAEQKLSQEQIIQPQEIIGHKVKDSLVNCSFLKSGRCSSFGWPHPVNSQVCSNPCTPSSSCTRTSTEFDRSDIWVSSLDLDLLHEKEPGISILGSNMPSTSTSRQVHQIRSSLSSSAISTIEKESEKLYDPAEPLFWPFDYNAYTCLDFNEFLHLSPPKEREHFDIYGIHEKSSRKSPQETRKNSQELKRTLNSMSRSNTCEDKRVGLHYTDHKTGIMSPGLCRSRNDHHKQSISKRRQVPPPQLTGNLPSPKSSFDDLIIQSSESLQLHETVTEGVSIEKLVGLTEFIGQEGISAEYEDDLDLCGSPLA